MLNLKTPGVYIQEISTLPASVAPVATAIPAFVGYTQTRELNGETLADYHPVRITSLLEYEEIFGLPFDENYNVELTDGSSGTEVSFHSSYIPSKYLLYYAISMYFANGGGPCYVISVGVYDYDALASSTISRDDLEAGINAVAQEDEPTIIVVPEISQLSVVGERAALNNLMLAQCNLLQDRFALMDVVPEVTPNATVKVDGDDFRKEVGTSYLKYGAAYYPPLNTIIPKYYQDFTVNITDSRSSSVFGGESLKTVQFGSGGAKAATATITFNSRHKSTDTQQISIGGAENYTFGTDVTVGASPAETATNFAAFVDANSSLVQAVADGAEVLLTAISTGVTGNTITIAYDGTAGVKFSGKTLEGGVSGTLTADLGLYNQIRTFLNQNTVTIPPSSSIAGIYAKTDRDRGVWKAPANVSVNNISGPSILVTAEEQGDLNVDANTGKSINVIRNFTGKGSLVWGSRTLAGNDNEWRYVPVRRLFIFIEESIKKATEPTVFEPNDANTWSKLKGLIENFLTSLWREGALAGAAPQDSFFVRIGLGETMTPVDILEGRLNIEIGLAAVRPAEFIILKFSHKLQES
ncbi:MAG: phage tail sheath C-terminal domain-containing protein [Bacteroidota bacterium]